MEAHLPGLLEMLERRRAAGTLLPGHCRAHEAAWFADTARTDVKPSGEPELDDEGIAQTAQLIGVAAYFAAARLTACTWYACQVLQGPPHEPLLGRCLNFIEHALGLVHIYHVELVYMNIPTAEELFLSAFRQYLLPYLKPVDPRTTRILEAWRRLEQSGLLQVMQVDKTREDQSRIRKSLADAQAAKDAGVPLRACGLPSCGAREAHVARFKKCGGCGQVVYCSKAHQAEHWPAHKAACKAARKAASQAAAEGGASQDA